MAFHKRLISADLLEGSMPTTPFRAPSPATLLPYVSNALPPHASDSFLTLVITQGKEPVECSDDNLLIGHPSARSPRFHALVAGFVQPDRHRDRRLNAG